MIWIILLIILIIIIILFSNKKKERLNVNLSLEEDKLTLTTDSLRKYPFQFEKSITINDDKLLEYIRTNISIGQELKIDTKGNLIRIKKANKILLIQNINDYKDIIDLFEYNHFFDIVNIIDNKENIEIIFGCFSDLEYSIFNTLHSSNIKFEPIDNFKYYSINSIAGCFVLERKNYILKNCNEGDELFIEEEPENNFDKNALKILHNNFLIGYIGKRKNKELKKNISNGYKMYIYGIDYDEKTDYIIVSYITYIKK